MDQATLQKLLTQEHKRKTSHSLAVEMVSSSTKSIYTQDQIISLNSLGLLLQRLTQCNYLVQRDYLVTVLNYLHRERI